MLALLAGMKLICTAHTHVGRRDNNEDSCCVEPKIGLFAVADGMGGYAGGEVASQLAIETFTDFVRGNAADGDITWPYPVDHRLSMGENIAAIGTRMAHEAIRVRRVGPLEQMGSTLAALLVDGARGIICHVGDSRVYRLRDGVLEPMTVDHSFYEELRASGCQDLPSREDFPHRNMITRALGLSGGPDLTPVELRVGDTFLLCTDGLSDELPEEQLAELMAADDIEWACARLVAAAYESGGRDNITAVLVRVVGLR